MHMRSLTRGLIFEAMAQLDVPTSTVKYQAPNASKKHEGLYIDSSEYALISTMRTGMGMSGAVQEIFEEAIVGHVYMERKHGATDFGKQVIRIPGLDNKFVFIFDSGLLSGATVMEVLRHIVVEKSVHPSRIAVITCLASHTAIETINAVFDVEENPVRIFTAAVDEWTPGKTYSEPGVGSFRERLYGWTELDQES